MAVLEKRVRKPDVLKHREHWGKDPHDITHMRMPGVWEAKITRGPKNSSIGIRYEEKKDIHELNITRESIEVSRSVKKSEGKDIAKLKHGDLGPDEVRRFAEGIVTTMREDPNLREDIAKLLEEKQEDLHKNFLETRDEGKLKEIVTTLIKRGKKN